MVEVSFCEESLLWIAVVEYIFAIDTFSSSLDGVGNMCFQISGRAFWMSSRQEQAREPDEAISTLQYWLH